MMAFFRPLLLTAWRFRHCRKKQGYNDPFCVAPPNWQVLFFFDPPYATNLINFGVGKMAERGGKC